MASAVAQHPDPRTALNAFRVDLPPLLDVGLCLSSGQTFRWTLREGVWAGVEGRHWYRIRLSGDLAEVESNGSAEDFGRFFRTGLDVAGFHCDLLDRAPELAPYVAALPGLRVLGHSDPNEVFFSFLCTANNHLKRIKPMVEVLASYGREIAPGLHRFPSAERIAQIGEIELRIRGFGYRARTIVQAAELAAERGWDSMRGLPYSTLWETLMGYPGVGPKLADCIALYGFGCREAVPIDTHMRQALARLYDPAFGQGGLTLARYRAAADAFRARVGEDAGWVHKFLYYENLLHWRERA